MGPPVTIASDAGGRAHGTTLVGALAASRLLRTWVSCDSTASGTLSGSPSVSLRAASAAAGAPAQRTGTAPPGPPAGHPPPPAPLIRRPAAALVVPVWPVPQQTESA